MKITGERELVIAARDAKNEYQTLYAAYLTGKGVTLDQVMEKRAASEKAERNMRAAIKGGTYKQIEKDLKAKYSKLTK